MSDRLQFTQVREDPLIDLEVLKATPQSDRHVLLVASAGCTAFSLLSDPSVASVEAVDFNPVQIALVRLKAAAIAALDLAEYRRFLGIDPGEPMAFWPQVAAELPAADRSFWEEHRPWLQGGLQEAGNYENLFALWRQFLHRFISEPTALRALFRATSLAEQQAVFQGFHPGYWPVSFTLAFHHEFLNTMFSRKATQHAALPYPVYFERVFRRAFCELPAGNNYFLSQLCLGEYLPVPGGVPPYLEPQHYPTVKSRLARLSLHHATFPGYLAKRQGPPYALVQLSNIVDWLSYDERCELADAVLPHVVKGSRILIRQLNNDKPLPVALAQATRSDEAWERSLWARERSFFYERVRAPEVWA